MTPKAERKIIDRCSIERENAYRRGIVETARRLVVVADADGERVRRHDEQLCPVCYVYGRIGGSRSTDRQCGLCDTIVKAGSTDVDVLCRPCASANLLCRRCGVDIDLKTRRKPRPYEAERKEA